MHFLHSEDVWRVKKDNYHQFLCKKKINFFLNIFAIFDAILKLTTAIFTPKRLLKQANQLGENRVQIKRGVAKLAKKTWQHRRKNKKPRL